MFFGAVPQVFISLHSSSNGLCHNLERVKSKNAMYLESRIRTKQRRFLPLVLIV
jgi:hypothetical protein